MGRYSCNSPGILEPIERRLFMASISGSLFNDLNGNGLRGLGEPALSGWTVYLDTNRDHVLNGGEPSTTTDPAGGYALSDLAPGNYSVAQVVPAGWEQTYPGSAAPAMAPVTLAPKQSPLTSDPVKSAIARLGSLSSYTRAQLSAVRSWVVGIPRGASIDALAKSLGAVSFRQTPLLPDTYILTFNALRGGQVVGTKLLAARDDLSFFYPLVGSRKPVRSIPDDPSFAEQWHLNNTGQSGGTAGADANVTSAWDSYKGNGVTIGIVDEGVEYTHEDLSANYSPALSYDFWSDDSDPSPGNFESHGTAVAGIAAARGFNGIGVSGAAPGASLASLRLIVGTTTDAQEAAALSHQPNNIAVYNNSWGPFDDGARLEGPGPLTLAALQSGATSGRAGLGNIYTWAAGNGLLSNDNVNYDGYANSRYVISVSAIDHNGKQSYYSEPGAPILVAGYSSGGSVGTTTTDRSGGRGYSSGDYTDDFGGTSSASPLVSGVVALMLQANPALTWRDVQHILVHSARKNDAGDDDWTSNAAGLHVNHKYGFGAIDAAAAVALAQNWTGVATEQAVTSGTLNVNQIIPDATGSGVTRTFNVTSPLRVETAEVVLNVNHPQRGQLRVVLTSPNGTQSVLAELHGDTNANYSNWVFTTRRSWDELAAGTWTIKVTDGASGGTGSFVNWKLNLYGTPPDSGSHYLVLGSAADTVSGKDFGAHDVAPPDVAESVFHFQTGQSITFTFDEDVTGIDAADLLLNNVTKSTAVGSINASYDAQTRTATFTFNALLTDGDYHATLLADGFTDFSGNHMTADEPLDFFVLGGDANRDRVVDVNDLNIVAANWMQPGRTFSQGNFDYDGLVDQDDLAIVSLRWQQNVLPPGSALSVTGIQSRTPATRVARLVL